MVVAKAIWLPFVTWLGAVITVAVEGRQPGVVCITPVAWLMALWVGLRCVDYSRREQKSTRPIQAALAGGIFGLLQGVLFALVAPLMGSIKPEERQKAVLLGVAMIVLGVAICAVLSMAIAAAQEKKSRVK